MAVTPTPLRSDDEVVGAYFPITLAGKEYRLAELSRRSNREYQRLLTGEVRDRIAAVGPLETADQVIEAIADSAEVMMDLLIAYDLAGTEAWPNHSAVLPDREWIDTHATDRECYESMKKVSAVVFPFGHDLLRLVPEMMPVIMDSLSRGAGAAILAVISSASTSSAPPSTDGSQTTSSAA